MCGTCGCHNLSPAKSDAKIVDVFTKILSENDRNAHRNRELFNQYNILCLNLMSSPGSGKTSLLESTIDLLKNDYRIAVIEGDLETENDAARIKRKGVPAIQIVTGTACHLEADMIFNAMQQLDLNNIDILFIENVGNLVCPASFDLGQHRNVTLLSVTEGDDKPEKYPVMFRAADLCLLTKSDLLPFLDDFNSQKAEHHLHKLGNPAECYTMSSRQPDTLQPWINWVLDSRQKVLEKEKLSLRLQLDGQSLHKEIDHESNSSVLA